MPELIRKRKGKKLTPVSNIYQKNIVFQFFLFGKSKFSDLDKSDFS